MLLLPLGASLLPSVSVSSGYILIIRTCTAACVRYYYVLKLENEEDIWFYFADSLNWCTIEVYAGKFQSPRPNTATATAI